MDMSNSVTLHSMMPFEYSVPVTPVCLETPFQSRAELMESQAAHMRLKRLEYTQEQLSKELVRHRMPVSDAAKNLIAAATNTKDRMVPQVWGTVPKHEDNYYIAATRKQRVANVIQAQNSGCCVIS
ncbi:hypothetical protein CANCADRAFT_133866 [Tortispora caseinolytica NRRL Y-17796]|uniref:Guanine nucleotide-binding protein subunit gamma n=1 Tax=Tortispora caseinolytica NRRL Y-17796 TaxID=767744 RepID=A0A1E4TBI4_9ASCO|nr:hypothetical protein CANCADRAFT_133866 [Tortispora caseinolytica NRRL Y-17796]